LFYVSDVQQNSGISSVAYGPGLRKDPIIVPTLTLNDLYAEHGAAIDLIKLDIEGGELAAFEGGSDLLGLDNAPALIFEAFNLPPLRQYLKTFGYQVCRIHYSMRNGLELLEPTAAFDNVFEKYESPNYFATKKSSEVNALIERSRARRSIFVRLLARLS
jgi:hypothetical protein